MSSTHILLILVLLSFLSLSSPKVLPPRTIRYRTTLQPGSAGFVLARHQCRPDYEETVIQPTLPPSDDGDVGFIWSPDTASSTLPLSACQPAPIPSCPSDPDSARYRSFDGTCNNLANPVFGSAGRPFTRFLAKKSSMTDCGAGSELPNPREVSKVVARRGEMELSKKLSQILMSYGQIIDHDIELTPPRMTNNGSFLDCCAKDNALSPDCCPIITPNDDPFYGKKSRPTCMPFLRSELVCSSDGSGQDILNSNTPYIDASFLYGSDLKRSNELRLFKDGRLNSSTDNRKRMFPPLNFTSGFRMEFGDSRGDAQPAATVISTVFLRNHNRLASELQRLHPDWSDQLIFQEARKINIAVHQNIVYTEFIENMLGRPNNVGFSDKKGQFQDFYDPSQDAAISMGFGTAAYRLHTFISGKFILRNAQYEEHGSLLLRDVFHTPLVTLANDTMDDMMRGLCTQPLHDFDNVFTEEMTEWLFKLKKNDFGMDIVSLNVQRGRDHMIPGYTEHRKFCGLGAVNTWTDMEDLIPGDLVHRLLHTYRRPEDVDLYVGGNMEIPLGGSILGPTFHCFVREQFERLRNADRFFYTNPGQFTQDQLTTISQQTLARLFCDNADKPEIMALPKEMFRLVNHADNPLFMCSDLVNLPKINMNAWS